MYIYIRVHIFIGIIVLPSHSLIMFDTLEKDHLLIRRRFCQHMFHQLSREVGLCSPAERAGPFLRGGFKDFWNFHPYVGKGSNLTSIFQMG